MSTSLSGSNTCKYAETGTTIHIDCMIISGFPGIGKTTTYYEMKSSCMTARVIDMDVRRYGTTNGINVEDPAAYVREIETRSKDNALIFCTIDKDVRAKLREANLFYVVIAPEFPPNIASQIRGYTPDPFARAAYMKRFTDNLGALSLTGETLSGRGYTDILTDLFNDPMPHLVAPVVTKAIVGQVWEKIERMSRQVLKPGQVMAMGNPENIKRTEAKMQRLISMFPGSTIPQNKPPQ